MLAVMVLSVVAAAAGAVPCRVGVDALPLTDASRVHGEGPRPIRVVLWYPASAPVEHSITGAALAAADGPPGGAPPGGEPDIAPCAGWLAGPQAGRFPLVLLGSGLGGRAYQHAALAEALAGAGFAVAFVGALGPAPGVPPRFDAATVRTLADDWTRALDALAADPRVDASHVAVVAWSVGTVVHLVVAQGRPQVRAGVSLDGGLAYDYGPGLWAAVAAQPPRAMPYLHLGAGVRGPVPADDTLLQQVDARVQVVEGLSHAQFLDVPAAAPPVVLRGRDMVRQAVRAFLERHLKAAGAAR
jgi:dienelactone hydrolase